MTMLEVFTGVGAIALAVGVFMFARLAPRIGRAADEHALAARRVAELTPAARELIESSHAELEALRSLTSTATHAVESVRSVSGRAVAVIAGVRAGLGMLRRSRSGNGSQSLETEESDQLTK